MGMQEPIFLTRNPSGCPVTAVSIVRKIGSYMRKGNRSSLMVYSLIELDFNILTISANFAKQKSSTCTAYACRTSFPGCQR